MREQFDKRSADKLKRRWMEQIIKGLKFQISQRDETTKDIIDGIKNGCRSPRFLSAVRP